MRAVDSVQYIFLSRSPSLKGRIRSAGGVVHYESRHSGTVTAVVPRSALARVLEDPWLVFAEAEQSVILPRPRIIEVLPDRTADRRMKPAHRRPTWNVRRVWRGQPPAKAGKGIRIGVIDTGIDLDHPDLAANIKGGFNIVAPGSPPEDDNGHGTHVAGIIAARKNRLGAVGVAPAASLYAIKALDGRGAGTVTHLIRGIDWGIDHGMHLLNLSLTGGRKIPAALVRAIRSATARGILIVAAAGNSGNAAGRGDTVQVPARLRSVLAVAALNRHNRRAPFSATGPSLDIAAPGVNILSTFSQGRYALLSGTSQAAPHVTGAAAVFRQRGMPAAGVKRHLVLRAMALGAGRLYGAGLVQIRPKR